MAIIALIIAHGLVLRYNSSLEHMLHFHTEVVMKVILNKLAVLLVLLPAFAFADVKSDMGNSDLSLVVVMQNAMTDGMSAGEAVEAMVKADKSQANAIVATAMIVAPDQYDAIVKAAIAAKTKKK